VGSKQDRLRPANANRIRTKANDRGFHLRVFRTVCMWFETMSTEILKDFILVRKISRQAEHLSAVFLFTELPLRDYAF
jgi:hypothetical protein